MLSLLHRVEKGLRNNVLVKNITKLSARRVKRCKPLGHDHVPNEVTINLNMFCPLMKQDCWQYT